MQRPPAARGTADPAGGFRRREDGGRHRAPRLSGAARVAERRRGRQRPRSSGEASGRGTGLTIFRLRMTIFRLRMTIFRLRMTIFRLKAEATWAYGVLVASAFRRKKT